MKQKIGVEIHKQGGENEYLLKMVANVNSMGLQISMEAVCNYLLVRNAMFPEYKKMFPKFEGENTLHISEDGGETFTLSLTWKEVEELQDIPDEVFTGGGVAEEKTID